MGFDIYGKNPSRKDKEPVMPPMDGDKWTDYQREQYDIHSEWELNSGVYFRNNVWWWRPMWDYCCSIADFTEKDNNEGHHNGGHFISKAKCTKLAKVLRKDIDQGMCNEYENALNKKNALNPDDWESKYPFTVDNCTSFLKFVENCGGFHIH